MNKIIKSISQDILGNTNSNSLFYVSCFFIGLFIGALSMTYYLMTN